MSASSVNPPFPIFTDIDGNPLESGYIYIGAANQNPETTPIAVFWDSAMTIAASQPIRTIGGYPVRSGTPSRFYVGSDYSITIKNKNGTMVYGAASGTEKISGDMISSIPAAKSFWTQVGTGATPNRNLDEKTTEGYPTPEDFGAVGNGTNDDTAALQKLFNAHKTVRFVQGKTYVSSKLSITNDLTIIGYGSKLLHKADSALNGVGLLEMKVDKTLKIYGLEVDGNVANQSAVPYAYYNMIWCSIGAMELYDCYIHDSKGHLIRTGNIDDFNASYFAHDIVIQNCRVINPTTTNSCGDNIRVERTRGALFSDNYVYGGLSSMRTQLYCKNLKFYNNDSCYAWGDVGITVAQSENLEIVGNYCHHNYRHGYEIDGVVNCTNMNNVAYRNGFSGFLIAESGAAIYANSPVYWGSIAEGYGTNYSNQTYTSPQVPNINTVHMNNVSIENGQADRLIGLDTDVYAYNYSCHNNQGAAASSQGQLGLEGGSLNRGGNFVMNNVFKPNTGDAQAIYIYNYQQKDTVSGNRVIGNVKLMNLAAVGMWDANRANRFLQDSTKRSVLLSPVNDSKSITGFALTHTTSSGPSTYPFTGMNVGGGGEKFLRFVARADAAVTVQVAAPLYLGNTYVSTPLPDTPWNLTTDYQVFSIRVPSVANVGDNIRPQITLPNGNTIYIQELNLYQAVGE